MGREHHRADGRLWTAAGGRGARQARIGWAPGARSSGDRAADFESACRRFESSRARPMVTRNPRREPAPGDTQRDTHDSAVSLATG